MYRVNLRHSYERARLNYKGTHHTLHVALPALDAWAEEQEKGRVPRG